MNLFRAFAQSMPVAFADTQRDVARLAERAAEPYRPHVGLLMLFGPEVRAFLYSGLAERLGRHARVSILTANPASEVFSTFRHGEVHAAPREAPSRPLKRFRGWNRHLHDAWLATQGQARWRHESSPPLAVSSIPTTSVAQTPKRFPRWLRTAHLMEYSLARHSGDGQSWERLLERLGLDCLIAADYASHSAAMALLAAARQNVATVVLANSRKDVYAHPYVDVPPDWIGVAGQPEADHLRRMSPHVRPDRIAVVGSLHLDPFLRPAEILSRDEFCRRAGLDASRPFLCYTAASPRAVTAEESIVRALLEAVEQHPARPQVLLRLNPREPGDRFGAVQARFSQCVVQKPRWEWDPTNDWNAPLPEDLDTWVAAVHHAAFNVSIPSTVTLEFAAMGRLTLNVCFDADPQPPHASNARYWDAPFYRQIRRSPLVAGAFCGEEFRELLACRLSDRGAWKLAPPRRAASPVEEAEKLVFTALAARGAKSRRRGP
jgi:hypothetical protein